MEAPLEFKNETWWQRINVDQHMHTGARGSGGGVDHHKVVVTCTPKTIELYHYRSLRVGKRWRKLGTYCNVAIDTAICREPLVNINVNEREQGPGCQ